MTNNSTSATPNIRLIYCPCGNDEEAAHIAQQLVQDNLVACVNIFAPMNSIYRWNGEIVTSREVAILCKTTDDLCEKAMERLGQLHSYDCPAIIAFTPENAPQDFQKWVATQCQG